MVEEKFHWMTETSPVTLSGGEKVKGCRAELLFDRSSYSCKRLSQTPTVHLPDPGSRHVSLSRFPCAFFQLSPFLVHFSFLQYELI